MNLGSRRKTASSVMGNNVHGKSEDCPPGQEGWLRHEETNAIATKESRRRGGCSRLKNICLNHHRRYATLLARRQSRGFLKHRNSRTPSQTAPTIMKLALSLRTSRKARTLYRAERCDDSGSSRRIRYIVRTQRRRKNHVSQDRSHIDEADSRFIPD